MAEDRDVIASSLSDPAAFEEIFDRHWDGVLRYARQRVGADIGEEIAARTFLLAFEQRAKFSDSFASAKPWLLGIATHLIHRQRRRERVHLAAMSRMPPTDGPPPIDDPAKLDAQALRAPILRALATLNPGERDAFLLLALAELSYPEIGLALGIPVGTVKSRINRARKRLRELIGTEKAIDDVISE